VALEADLALGGLLEAGDHARSGGLAAARRAEHGEELAALDVEVRVVDRYEGPEAFRDVVDRDDDVIRTPDLVAQRIAPVF
jgi:hypothetical protein